LLLNNDAALFADALQTLLTEALRFEQPAILALPQFDATTGALVDRGCLLDPFYNPVPNLNPNCTDVAMVIGACLWIPKKLWDELEGFPEWFGSIAEDMYLCCRARLAGYAVRALAVSGYRHWQGRSFGGNKPQGSRLCSTFRRRQLSERNKTFVLIVVSPAVLLALVLPWHLLLLHVEGLLLSILKMDASVWARIYAPITPALWRKQTQLWSLRQATQGRSRINLRNWLRFFVPVPYKMMMLCKYGLPKIG
jgi:GT2 family glycosyltransferase